MFSTMSKRTGGGVMYVRIISSNRDWVRLLWITWILLFETYAAMVEPMQDLFRKRLTADAFQIEVERDGKVQKAGTEFAARR